MKTILLFLCTFLISLGTFDEEVTNFNETCNNSYEYYVEYVTKDSESYYLNVKYGVYNNLTGYSIYFVSGNANEYKLKYINKSKQSNLSNTTRGDYLIYFASYDNNSQLGIYKDDTLTETIDLKNYSIDEFNKNYGTNVKGNNNGFPRKTISSLTKTLSLIFSIIILVGIIVIIILAILRKGMFSKNYRQEELLKEESLESEFIESGDEVEVVDESIEENKDVDLNEPEKEVYTKVRDYEDECRDISLILQEKGFNTNYKELSMDEKNKVMLELMRMKDFKEITSEEYRSEVIKLWS